MTSPSPQPGSAKRKKEGDLSVTALYTAQAWVFGGFDGAELFATKESKRIFNATNLVLKLVGLFKPGPALAESLAQRHAMFDYLVSHSGATQVIELAAGLSRRGTALSKDLSLQYTELDLPAMSAKKRELLARTPEGRRVLARPNLRLEAADVRDADLASYLDSSKPACILAEGLFMYLQAPEQRALWRRIAEALRAAPSGDFIFDLTPVAEKDKPGIAGRALDRLMKLFTGGRSFEADTRSRHDIASELKDAGFDSVEFLEPAPLLQTWNLPFPKARTQVLLFHCHIAH